MFVHVEISTHAAHISSWLQEWWYNSTRTTTVQNRLVITAARYGDTYTNEMILPPSMNPTCSNTESLARRLRNPAPSTKPTFTTNMVPGGHASFRLAISALQKPVIIMAAMSMMFLLLWNFFFVVWRGVSFLFAMTCWARVIGVVGLHWATTRRYSPASWMSKKDRQS